MSAFSRLSMGVRYGVRVPREEPVRAIDGSHFFVSFGSRFTPRSEQLADEPLRARFVALRMGPMKEAERNTADYWRLPWRRPYAPAALRGQQVRVIWSKRVGM